MATLTNVLQFARAQAQTDANGIKSASATDNGILFANAALLDFRRRLQADGVDAAQLQESYTDMDADVGTYLYPTDMYWLKAIQLNYSGNNANDYITAQQVDVSNLPSNVQSFGWFRENASTEQPFFNDMGDWFEIFPTPLTASSQGIRIWYFKEVAEYTGVNDTISYPESLDYRILGWRIASLYYKSLNKFDEATDFDNEYEKMVRDIIQTLGKGVQQPMQAMPIQDTGWQY